MRMYTLTFGVLACAVVAAQPPDDGAKDRIQRRVRELYGEAAPASITFVRINSPATAAASDGKQPASGSRSSVPMGVSDSPPSQNAAKGDEATGVVVLEQGNELYLDALPCSARIATFVKPYKKSEAGTTTCNGVTHKKHRIVKE